MTQENLAKTIAGPDRGAASDVAPVPYRNSVPGYELLEEIGRGGMSAVYRARDLRMHRDVAVKILCDEFSPDSITAQRFLEEANITGQLQHPGIPAVHHVGALPDGRPFIVMKLIQGQTLEKLIANQHSSTGGPLDVLAIFESLCQAVGYAHANHVIHRDLKPANIMVGAFGEVQVMDWGLAKVLPNFARWTGDQIETADAGTVRSQRDTETQTGSAMGTPAYMPPEQARGESARINARSDVFGLGAVLCNLLTGEPPYSGVDVLDTLQNAVHGRTEEALARLDRCGADPEVVALCKRCLALDPAHRPANGGEAAEAVAALRQAADRRAKQAELEKVQATIYGRAQRKRRQTILITSIAMIAALTCGIAVSVSNLFSARKAANDARLAESKEREARAAVERERDIARQRFQLAVDAFEHLVFEIQQRMHDKGASAELRRDLLKSAQAGLKKLLAFADQDRRRADRTLLVAHSKMGDVCQLLGDTEQAIEQLQLALDMAKQLRDEDPSSLKAQRDVVVCLTRLGDLSLQRGDLPGALKLYGDSMEITKKQATAEPTNLELQRDLSLNLERIGDVQLQQGDLVGALQSFEKSLALRQSLAPSRHSESQRDLALAHEKIGNVRLRQNDTVAALKSFRETLAICQKRSDAEPKNVEALRDLSVVLGTIGDVHMERGDIVAALKAFEESLAIDHKLAAADPANAEAQRDLGISIARMGNLYFRQADFTKALKFSRESVAIRRKLADADPTNAEFQLDLSVAYGVVGDVELKLEHVPAAMEAYRSRADIVRKLAAKAPTNAEVYRLLAISYEKLGAVCLQTANFAEGARWYDLMIDLVNKWPKPKELNLNMKFAERNVVLCRKAERAVGDLEFIFAQKADEIPGLAAIRVAAQIKKRNVSAATATADRFAAWVELQTINRGENFYNAACTYALCAAALAEPQRESYASKAMALLNKTKAAGYFTRERIGQLKKDKDLDALRQRDDFKAMLVELSARERN